ncbi:MAG: macro domain-containing protein [Planctomycetales bacterium]|nr:macro domain-containing protein [Planctomycetales bacterium]
MIHEVEGDILLSEAQAIAHGVAFNDPMKSGLALALHERFPMMHKDFHHWCHQHKPETGTAWMWGGAEGVRIINLVTQEGGSAHSAHPFKATLSNVKKALKELKKLVVKEKLRSVAIPKLATGVGGLNWEEVQPLIKEQLSDLGIPVYVYSTYHTGIKAKEPSA